MDMPDSHSRSGYSRGFANPCSISFTEGVFRPDIAHSASNNNDTYAGDDDVVRIARGIFTTELADLITVLRCCGALNTKSEYFWCVYELWRLLTKPNLGDVA